MNTHTAQHGLTFSTLRAALHLRQRPLQWPTPAATVARPGWLERLAIWAERQPMHHRMGSYTLPR